jgi:hypothetical protein
MHSSNRKTPFDATAQLNTNSTANLTASHTKILKHHKQAISLTFAMAISETKTPLKSGISVGTDRSPTYPFPNCSKKDVNHAIDLSKNNTYNKIIGN